MEAGYGAVEVGSVMGASLHIALVDMPDLPGIGSGVVQLESTTAWAPEQFQFDEAVSIHQGLTAKSCRLRLKQRVLRNGGARGSLAVEGSRCDKLWMETASGLQCSWVGSRGRFLSGDLRRMAMGGGWMGLGDGRAVILIPSIFDPCWAVPRTSEQLLKPCKQVSTQAR